MAVVIYQLIIVATVWGLYKWKPQFGLWAAIAWSVETLVFLFFPPLILIQLGVVWGTYFLVSKGDEKETELAQMRRTLAGNPEETKRRFEEAEADEIKWISGKAHRKYLLDAIWDANRRLCILSGWISDRVMDGDFMVALDNALQRGTNVFIGYGFSGDSGHQESAPAQRARANLDKLKRKHDAQPQTGTLRIARFPNHEKIVAVDDTYVMCGSNNWLSNSQFTNAERSVAIHSPQFAASEGERIQQQILQHA